MLEARWLELLRHGCSRGLLGHVGILWLGPHGHVSLLIFEVLLDSRSHLRRLVAHRVLRPLTERHFSADDRGWLPLGILRVNLALVRVQWGRLIDLLVHLCAESHVQ